MPTKKGESASGTIVKKIVKRDGRTADFDKEKITNAVFKAASAIGGEDRKKAEELAEKVVYFINQAYDDNKLPTVENVQDIVETVLIKEGHAKTAKAYIIYRQKRAELRRAKKEILGGMEDKSDFNLNQIRIAEAKYLERDDEGNVTETPEGMFRRVARCLASPEKKYCNDKKVNEIEEEFYQSLRNLEFIPGGRTLANAGTPVNQLANCFVVPVEDSMYDIFESVKEQALIQKTGGGTGFDFSRLRPRGTRVIKSNGIASGPVTFIKVFDAATSVIMQGNRRGANMGMLRVDHPDIVEFITAKDDLTNLTNFNISVSITDKFMEALKEDTDYDLIDPHTKEVVKKANAKEIFSIIVTHAWRTGEPGIIFIDRINKLNPTKHVGLIEATNPCGEVPLHPYEACNLGSVNLDRMVINGEIDWNKLKRVTRTGTRLLDNVIDGGTYPLEKIDKMVKANRRIGLGVLGWGDMLYQLGIPYNSEEAVKLGEKVMKHINDEAYKMSQELAEEKETFPYWKGSDHEKKGIKMRNATVTSIAPTGTLSMLAETTGGIEPNFAICFIKNVLGGEQFIYVNRHFEKVAREQGFYSESLMKRIAERGTICDIKEIPDHVKRVFVTSHDITPGYHIKMQAAFQKHVDNSMSKTINFHKNATVKDVENGYLLAYGLGCKGVTVYRDGSRYNQVLNIKEVNKEEKQEIKRESHDLRTEKMEKKAPTPKVMVAGDPGLMKTQAKSFDDPSASLILNNELTAEEMIASSKAAVEKTSKKMNDNPKNCPDCVVKLDDK